MNGAQKIYNELKFLEEYFPQSYVSDDNKSLNITFYKYNCAITYHEFPQFGDFNIIVSNNFEDYNNKKYKRIYGINWIVQNVLPIYKCKMQKKEFSNLELIKFYLNNQIENKKDIFGIEFNEWSK